MKAKTVLIHPVTRLACSAPIDHQLLTTKYVIGYLGLI